MHIAVRRSRDHKQQRAGLAVRGVIIHTAGHGHRRQCRMGHAVALRMRYRNALADGSGALSLSRQDRRLVGRRVR